MEVFKLLQVSKGTPIITHIVNEFRKVPLDARITTRGEGEQKLARKYAHNYPHLVKRIIKKQSK